MVECRGVREQDVTQERRPTPPSRDDLKSKLRRHSLLTILMELLLELKTI